MNDEYIIKLKEALAAFAGALEEFIEINEKIRLARSSLEEGE